MMWRDFERNEHTAETCAWKENKYCSLLYYIDKSWYHFIKEYLEFSKFAFQEVACPVERPNRHVLEILLTRRHILVAQNRQASIRLHHCLAVLWSCMYCALLYVSSFNSFLLNIKKKADLFYTDICFVFIFSVGLSF